MKRSALHIFCCLLLMCCCSLAQPNKKNSTNRKMDSLKAALRGAKEDTAKVNTLYLLTEKLWKSGLNDTALVTAYEAKVLAEKLGYKKGLAACFHILGIIYSNIRNYPRALENYNASLKIKIATGNKKGMATTYNNIGEVYRYLGNYPEALKNYTASMRVKKELGDKKGIANTLVNIGKINTNQGNIPAGLNNFFAALKIYDETNEKGGMANVYTNLGIIYKDQKNNSEALKNYNAALAIWKEKEDKAGIADAYNNIGNLYYFSRNFPEALKSYSASLKLREEINDPQGVATAYHNIGMVYADEGNYKEAMEKYLATLDLLERVNDKEAMGATYNNIGLLNIKLNKIAEAKRFLNKGLLLSGQLGIKEDMLQSYYGLSRADSISGNFKGALVNYKMYIVYADSLTNEENTKKTVQAQMQYEFDKKTTADSVKNAEVKKLEELKHGQEIARQKTFTYSGVAGFIVMIIVAGISYAAFRNKRKANIEIARQKLLVEEKQKEILDSIYYARRIQRALLTPERYIARKVKHLQKK
jgi:tetratricopeptide (TPR) repeat protein